MATRSDEQRGVWRERKRAYRARRIEAGLSYYSDAEKEARKKQRQQAKERRRELGLPVRTEYQQQKRNEQRNRARARKKEAGTLVISDREKAYRKEYRKRYKAKLKEQRAIAKAERNKERETPEWIAARKQQIKEIQRKHYYANIEYYKVRNAIKQAQRKALYNELDEFSKFVFSEAHFLRLARTKMTGFDWHVDHIVPISRGGTSRYDNLQVVPAAWNMKKGNRHSERFIKYGL